MIIDVKRLPGRELLVTREDGEIKFGKKRKEGKSGPMSLEEKMREAGLSAEFEWLDIHQGHSHRHLKEENTLATEKGKAHGNILWYPYQRI